MKTLRVLVVPLLLSACASTGDPRITNRTLTDQIRPGTTTKIDVSRLFGGPTVVDFTEAGLEKWVYSYTYAQVRGSSFIPFAGSFVGGTDTQNHTLTVLFRKDGVVENVGKGSSTGGGGGLQDIGRTPRS